MTDLLWPGAHRAEGIFDDATVLDALLAVETAWLRVLVNAGIAPAPAEVDLSGRVAVDDLEAAQVESGGNPVIPLVRLLRARLGADEPAARWLHRVLTSQDVLDTALQLCLRATIDRV